VSVGRGRPGEKAERHAARHYRLRGYRIVGRNVRAGGNELDLILRRGRRLVFCEVKEKTGDGFGDPLEMVDEEKRRRVRRAATAWLAVHPESAGLDVAFELVAVRGGRLTRLEDDLT
jgi:putative endonuclease